MVVENFPPPMNIEKSLQWIPLDYDQERDACRFGVTSDYGVSKCHLINSSKG